MPSTLACRIHRNVLRSVAFLLSLGFAAVAANAQSVAPAPSGANAQGIKVSGYWKIDVKNPDGTLTKHIEFENALTPIGGADLVSLLIGDKVNSGFAITAISSPNSPGSPCGAQCISFTSGTGDFFRLNSGTCFPTFPSKNCAGTLTTQASGSSVTLRGNITAGGQGTITSVGTGTAICSAAFSVSDCRNGAISFDDFTSFTLGTPLTVSQGQIVQFTVVLSFS